MSSNGTTFPKGINGKPRISNSTFSHEKQIMHPLVFASFYYVLNFLIMTCCFCQLFKGSVSENVYKILYTQSKSGLTSLKKNINKQIRDKQIRDVMRHDYLM